MKLRIRGNSLRLRLMQGEVRQLRIEGRIADGADFGPGGRLEYCVVADAGASRCAAELAGSVITVRVPTGVVADWADGEGVSIEAEQPLPHGSRLRVLVEKDYACLADRPDEDDSDAFPNPGGACP